MIQNSICRAGVRGVILWACALMVVLVYGGCTNQLGQHPAVSEERLMAAPVVELEIGSTGGPRGLGTAIVLTPDLLLTCRHVVQEAVTLRVSGADVTHGVVELGAGTADGENDWALLRLDEPIDTPRAILDARRVIKVGDPLFLIGWTIPPGEEESRFTVLETFEVGRPVGFADAGSNLWFAAEPDSVELGGASGGALAVWDEQFGGFVVVGMHVGTTRARALLGGSRGLLVAHRLSEAEIDGAIQRALSND